MQIHKNSFEGGLNSNIAKSLLPANKYFEANNVNIALNQNFFALENIKGTTEITVLPEGGYTVLAVFRNNYRIDGVSNVPCLTIITVSSFISILDEIRIWAFNTVTNEVYHLYSEYVDLEYKFTNPVFDAVNYPENGLDILYFTDNYFGLRKLICDIPDSNVSNFLTKQDLKLLQSGAIAPIATTVTTGNGSLLCGSYQIAYQFCNPVTNQFTKFSLFSNPCHIYSNSDNQVISGVGLVSNRGIYVTIRPFANELDYYTHVRLAVLENVYPNNAQPEYAQLSQLFLISDYESAGTLIDIPYLSNARVDTIPLSEILVDKMALHSVKTLAVKDNRLIGGNVTYKDLSYDNGDPVVGSGSVIKKDGGSSNDNYFTEENQATQFRGYFRDEVYRYAISYFDEDGNFSYPKVLDMSNITYNQIGGLYKDMKFPSRSQNIDGETFTLFSSGGGIQSLGLSLEDIDNHPTWAKGFVILRAERKKNIIFQTPLIPTEYNYAIGAVEEYPYKSQELSGTSTKEVEHSSAQPMGPFYSWLPRNYYHLKSFTLVRNGIASGAGTKNAKFIGEAYLKPNLGAACYPVIVYPPDFMYNQIPFILNQNYSLNTVDAALVKGKYSDFSVYGEGVSDPGMNIKTSMSATFYAVQDQQYYYNSSHNGAKPVIGGTRKIKAFEAFDNFGTPTVVGGLNVFNHDKFTTEGISWGQAGAVQKCGVFVLDEALTEVNISGSVPFAAGSQISRDDEYEFYTTDGTYVHTIEIANVVADLPDDRYGPYDTPHNFVSTGAIYLFDSVELAQVQAGNSLPVDVEVWGGDCYTVPHLFKITDTVYGTTNPNKYGTLVGGDSTNLETVQNWERAFNDDASNQAAVCVPVPFKNAAQFVQVVLESEYNPSVMDLEVVNVVTSEGSTSNKIPVYGITNFETSCRIPLTYRLNHNHKKENSDKIWSIKDPLLKDNTEMSARLIYSDQKIYQTSHSGFDVFRTLNIKDLAEVDGDITKLIVVGDDLYCIQERAVSYVNVGKGTVETADGLSLSIQSGDVISNIIPLDNTRGSAHLRTVLNTGHAAYFVDQFNRTINRVAGRQVQVLSEEEIASTLRTLLDEPIDQNKLFSLYDPVRKQVWFVNNSTVNSFCLLYDEARQLWVANYQFPAGTLTGGVYTNDNLWLTSKVGSPAAVNTMYTGERTILFGTTVTPNVKFAINPNMEFSKVFDDLLVTSSDRLNEVDLIVTRELSLGDQSVSGITLDVTSRGEGNFRAKVLRDSSGARLRGLVAEANLKWKSGDTTVASILPSVLTKYRISENRF